MGGSILDNPYNALIEVGTFLSKAILWAHYMAAAAAVIYLLVGAFNYMTARDDDEKLSNAKETLYRALVGLVLILISFLVFFAIGAFLGVDLFQNNIPNSP